MDSEADTGRCAHKLCGKNTYVHKCEFCNGNFCIEHIMPKPPRKPVFDPTSQEDRELLEEYSHPGGHPCPPYYAIWKAEKDAEKEKYKKAMKGFSGEAKPAIVSYEAGEVPELSDKPPKEYQVEAPKELPKEPTEEPTGENKKPTHAKSRISRIHLIIILFFVLAIGVLYLGGSHMLVSAPANCSDGTLSGFCSDDQPYFCSNGKLLQNATFCGCPKNLIVKDDLCLAGCDDGTLEGECSYGKPLYCLSGSLIPKATLCGCPTNYLIRGDACKANLTCSDGTLYDECSDEKPLYCLNGELINKSSICNCSGELASSGDQCVTDYLGGQNERILNYTIRGKTLGLKVNLYEGIDKYLAQLPRTYTCDPTCPTQEELQKRFLDDERQKTELEKIVVGIRSSTRIKDDQARIAVSLVQTIPYDTETAEADNNTNRYPYQVLYENKGLCGEKSRLLAFLLRELGYETVLLDYKQENHMAVGIKCPFRYAQYIDNASYCFIETTSPTIITDNKGDYANVGKLNSNPTIYLINKGNSFDSVLEEWRDANEWQALNKLADASNGQLIQVDYNKWTGLVKKYNMQITNQTQTNT